MGIAHPFCIRGDIMNQLWLRLSNKIKATLIRNVKDTDYFAINKSFQIIHLFCDDKELCFQEEITIPNFIIVYTYPKSLDL